MSRSAFQLLIITILFLSPHLLFAQWRQVSDLNSAWIVEAIQLSNGNWITLTKYSGIYKSTDGGINWIEASDVLIGTDSRAIAASGNTVLIANENGVFRSADGGDTWGFSNTDLTETDIHTVTYMGQFIVGHLGGMSSSSDGASWSSFGSGIEEMSTVNGISMELNTNTIWYASSNYGLYISGNSGSDWSKMNLDSTFPEESFLDVTAGMTLNHVVLLEENNLSYLSDNNGFGFEAITGISPMFVYSLFQRSGTTGIYAGSSEGLLYISDFENEGGWEQATTYSGNNNVTSFWTGNNDVFIIGTSGGIYRSSDAGSSWLRSNTGIENSIISELVLDGDKLIAGTEGDGIFISEDEGKTWTSMSNGLSARGLFINSILVTESFLLSATGTGIYKSTDGGENWVLSMGGLEPKQPFEQVLLQGSSIYSLRLNGDIYKSVDNGSNWSITSVEGSEAEPFGPQSMSSDGTNLYAASRTENAVFMSSDGGDSWVDISDNLSSTSTREMHIFYDQGTIYLSNNNGFFKSTNQGETWSEIGEGLPGQVEDHFINSEGLFVTVYESGVYRSTDEGENFTAYNTELGSLLVGPLADEEFYVGTKGQGVFVYSTAPDNPEPPTFDEITRQSATIDILAPKTNCGGCDMQYAIIDSEMNTVLSGTFTNSSLSLPVDELAIDTEYSYAIQVTTAYGTKTSSYADFQTLDNESPVFEGQSFDFEENSVKGSVVGTLVYSDEEDDDVTLSIISGNEDETFEINTLNQIILKDSTAADFELNEKFELLITATDEFEGSTEASVEINIIDVDEEVLHVDFDENHVIQIFPNPVQDLLSIHGEFSSISNIQIIAYQMNGEKVVHIDTQISGKLNTSLDTSAWRPGMYILHVLHSNDQSQFKIVKY